MTKVAFSSRIWAVAYIRGPKHAYTDTFLRMQLGFQKHKKFIFSAIMTGLWNESYIIWEPLQIPFVPLYKALHGTYIEIPREKPKIRN